jgi:hypothetical protein
MLATVNGVRPGPQNWLLVTRRRSPAIANPVGHWKVGLVIRETIRPRPYWSSKSIFATLCVKNSTT